jgi:hypothetical protein
MPLPSAVLGGSFDFAHGQTGTRHEAHGFVQPARARIAFADVQKRRDAAPAVAGEERAHGLFRQSRDACTRR